MTDAAAIRITEGDKEIFRDVLRSLESNRPAKSEADILDKLREQFELPMKPDTWPDLLMARQVSVESFLDNVFELLTPFVEMVLELYDFFSTRVSTPGGRTTHFEINAEGKTLRFPTVNFPHRQRWIEAWMETHIEMVTIDWKSLGRLLVIDNGIYYGTVNDVRLLQSFVVARRDGYLSGQARSTGDRICGVLRRAVSAWIGGIRSNRAKMGFPNPRRWVRHIYVPTLERELSRGSIFDPEARSGEIGVDVYVALRGGSSPYSFDDVFVDTSYEEAVPKKDEDGYWSVDSAIFFVALWGLDEPSFRLAAGHLTTHDGLNILARDTFDSQYEDLAARLIQELEATIVPTGAMETAIERVQQKRTIPLLPYWRDRWFLYEVWVLCRPMIETLSLGGDVRLLGTREIANEEISGISWDLPTQKSKHPVASLFSKDGARQLFVWFQRETPTSFGRHIEPDVRISKADSPDDICILECKDRIKFRRRSWEKVATAYLKGSTASVVWILNYEGPPQKNGESALLQKQGPRDLGVAYNFRPGSIHSTVEISIRETLGFHLGLFRPYDLIIDVSGSMRSKLLPKLPGGISNAFFWSDRIQPVPITELVEGRSFSSWTHGAENGNVFAGCVAGLRNDRVLVITDRDGQKEIERHLTANELKKRHIEFTII